MIRRHTTLIRSKPYWTVTTQPVSFTTSTRTYIIKVIRMICAYKPKICN